MAAGPAPSISIFSYTFAEATVGKIFIEADAELPDIWKEYATEKAFPTLQHTDGWIGMMPKPRMWIGSRVVHEPAAQTYTVVSRPWEHTEGIDRFTADADLIGLTLICSFSRRGKRGACRLTGRAIGSRDLARSSELAWTANPQLGTDGLTFFNTAHLQGVYQTGGATYSMIYRRRNQRCGRYARWLREQYPRRRRVLSSAFMTLAEYMMQYRGEDGEPLGAMPSTAMFPASLFGESQLVLKSMSFAPPAWGSIGSQVGAADNPCSATESRRSSTAI